MFFRQILPKIPIYTKSYKFNASEGIFMTKPVQYMATKITYTTNSPPTSTATHQTTEMESAVTKATPKAMPRPITGGAIKQQQAKQRAEREAIQECSGIHGEKIGAFAGFREFMMHPMTWDRNNGFFNILIGLAIFAYCFCTACNPEKPTSVSNEIKKKK